MQKRNLTTVRGLARKYPDIYTEAAIRWKVFNAESNGLADAGAVMRDGRKVIIDEDRWFQALEDANFADSGERQGAA